MPCNQVRSKIDRVSGSQTFSQNFHRKVLSNLLKLSDVCLEMCKTNLAFSGQILRAVQPIVSLGCRHFAIVRLRSDCGARSRIDQMPGSQNFSKCH